VAFACGVTEVRAGGGRQRYLRPGFFLAAAVATNIFMIVFALGFPLLLRSGESAATTRSVAGGG
jgi:hypothetical protein